MRFELEFRLPCAGNGSRPAARPCGKSSEKNCDEYGKWLIEAVSFREIEAKIGVPPPPTPFKSLDWHGFCENGLQNLERLGVRGQNLENKGVARIFLISSHTAFASAMMGQPSCGAQGQMSHRRTPCSGKLSIAHF